jgi:hypothetical protein
MVDLFSTNSETTVQGRNVAPLQHIILTIEQPDFSLTPEYTVCLREKHQISIFNLTKDWTYNLLHS